MAVKPIEIAQEIQRRFRRYLLTAFPFPEQYADLRRQFEEELAAPERLFRGPFLHGLAPYAHGVSLAKLIEQKVLPKALGQMPFFDRGDRPLYTHQEVAIRRLRQGRNVIVSTGTGSGKTFTFLIPILAEILESGASGVHALLLYPMNALVNDQLKNLSRLLGGVPQNPFRPVRQQGDHAGKGKRWEGLEPRAGPGQRGRFSGSVSGKTAAHPHH